MAAVVGTEAAAGAGSRPGVGVREDRKAATRQQIQRATLDLIEDQGLEAVTVGRIAERAGISERTFFRYFGSKEAAAVPGQADLTAALVGAELPPGPPGRILQELTSVSRARFAAEVEHYEFRRISRVLLQEPKLLQVVTRQELDLVEALSASLVERGLLSPLRALLVAEMVACTWRVAWQCFAREEAAGRPADPLDLFEAAVADLAEIAAGAGPAGRQPQS
ncbi:HTH-type transcriptional regulator BetI [Arthrobacter saudimassiliensis]|uniref:HTH-type transcriptional regulator BetI n=1 Tax=Arthrobacter saudimassiliensis TaxID=1461584 RepID=A0A078ML09_9MICC|nr:HTH-type transcriptional regulator BetI [Arthrobacter saudimassiliensis]